MSVEFVAVEPSDRDDAVELLIGNDWPFHGTCRPTRAWAEARADEGFFGDTETLAFWILEGGIRCGLVRATEIEDPTPLTDFRIAADARGRGLGTRALEWITTHLFSNDPELRRIGGYTRHDNLAMRKVFEKCGYVQEAHHRESWPIEGAEPADAIGYAILKREWTALNG